MQVDLNNTYTIWCNSSKNTVTPFVGSKKINRSTIKANGRTGIWQKKGKYI